jgi:UDP-N-acetylglucosamine 1-carboxyvinyltransferase
MIAALLSPEETILENVPDVGDVQLATQMIEFLGGQVEILNPHSVRIDPQKVSGCELPPDLAKKSRASFMFAGPLLARCEEIVLPRPGGDRIGQRPIDRHLAGLETLGAEVQLKSEAIRVRSRGLKGTRFQFHKNTHTGTETLIMAAVLAEGQTILENAAQEPEVDELISFLNCMGANILRVKPRTIIIEGVPTLRGTIHEVMPDRNEAVSFACMALATKGDVWIERVRCAQLNAFLQQLKNIGAGFEVHESSLHVWYSGQLKPIHVRTAPHPGVMSDWQPLLTTLMTQANGTSVVHETVFERRFDYVEELQKMGADIELFQPSVANPDEVYNFNLEDDAKDNFHAVRIHGPTPLHGIEVEVKDVRAGATLVQAALTAQGQTAISGVGHIERGYEGLDARLRELGASIHCNIYDYP